MELKTTLPVTVVLFTLIPTIRQDICYGEIVDIGRKEVEGYELPLSLFTSRQGTSIAKQDIFLTHFALIVKGRSDCSFNFSVKSASLINNTEFDLVERQYKENVMFRHKNRYTEDGIETGVKKFVITK